MKCMKIFLILLLLPLFSIGQTVHIKDDKIIYEGKEEINGSSSGQTFEKIQKQLPQLLSYYRTSDSSGSSVKGMGQLQLTTPYPVLRSVFFTITVNPTDSGYDYLIDEVFFTQRERGKKPVVRSAKEVLEGINETGKVVGETEKILNETDMRFQKLLSLLKSAASSG